MVTQWCHGSSGRGAMASCWCLTRHNLADCQIGGSLMVAPDDSNNGNTAMMDDGVNGEGKGMGHLWQLMALLMMALMTMTSLIQRKWQKQWH
eukprot:5714839-Ditylum_brightwellii.AAC.1